MSNKINSTVEVNGTRYDALTGQMLSPKNIINKGYGSGKKMIEGFVIASHSQVKKVKAVPARVTPKAESLHKRAQRSTTLVRRSVKKPAQAGIKSEPEHQPKHHHVTPQRQNRAKTVERHSQVNRFGLLPSRRGQPPAEPAGLKISAKASYRDAAVSQPRLPSMVSSVSHKKLEQMLDEALLKADAHKTMMGQYRPASKLFKRVPKWLSFSVAAVVILAAAFWLVWQNLPSVAVHVAAARAHVNAVLPTYTPDGFGLAGRINYDPGTVTMQFKDKSSRSFSLTQKASDLNSAAIPDTMLKNDPSVQTSMIGGTTVYIYGDHNDATWVNHGVLYNLNNSADLPADQVLKIVQGL